MYECRTIRLRYDLQVMLTGRKRIVPCMTLRMRRTECMSVIITSFSRTLKQGPLVRAPGDLLASSIVAMRHIILITHGDFLALIASQFQTTTDVGCD